MRVYGIKSCADCHRWHDVTDGGTACTCQCHNPPAPGIPGEGEAMSEAELLARIRERSAELRSVGVLTDAGMLSEAAAEISNLRQRVGELEAELKAEQARAFHLAAITCDTPAGDEGGHKYCTRIRDLEAALAEARKMPEWIKEELDLKRRMVDACKNLSPDTCIDCLRDQKFIQAAMQHCATPAKEKP